MNKKKSVVVLGGGTGIYAILRGLKQHNDTIETVAVVTMSDSGGSTGRLRDEFGQLPMGDVRMALVALARESNDQDQLLRSLFLHRFNKGKGLVGHNFGNLLIVALTEIIGDEASAVEAASRLLEIHGKVLPVTTDQVHLVAEYDDGKVVKGEHRIDEPPKNRRGKRIINLRSEPQGKITNIAERAILSADLIVLGPGDLYSSLISILVIDGVSEAIRKSSGKFLYNVNLMTRMGQTDNFTLFDHVTEVAKYTGREPDFVSFNTAPIDGSLLGQYETEFQYPVKDDGKEITGEKIKLDLLSQKIGRQRNGDKIKRSLVRNDSEKFAQMILKILSR